MKLCLCGGLGGNRFDDCLDGKGANREPAAQKTKSLNFQVKLSQNAIQRETLRLTYFSMRRSQFSCMKSQANKQPAKL